jgi:hypothetical protein
MRLSEKEVNNASLSTLKQEQARVKQSIDDIEVHLSILRKSLQEDEFYYFFLSKTIYLKERAQEGILAGAINKG